MSSYSRKNPNLIESILVGIFGGLFAALILVVYGIPLAIINGFVFLKLWNWFILPAFPSSPHLSFWAAAGIIYLVRFAANYTQPTKKNDKDQTQWGVSVFSSFLSPFMVLFLGYLIHLFA